MSLKLVEINRLWEVHTSFRTLALKFLDAILENPVEKL